MRTIAEVFADATTGGVIDLADEEVLGSKFVRPPRGLTVTGGKVLGGTSIYGAVGFCWSGFQIDGQDEDGQVLGILGGADWTLRDGTINGGAAYAQLQIGLEAAAKQAGIPLRWTVDNVKVTGNKASLTHPYPQDHSLYILTSPEKNMEGVLRNCYFGPSENGHVVKVGGTGGNPLTEGTNGVTFIDCTVETKQWVKNQEQGAVMLQGLKTQNIRFENLTVLGGPSEISVADGARVTFAQTKPWPGHTKVKYYWPSNTLRIQQKTQVVTNGRSYTGVTWEP